MQQQQAQAKKERASCAQVLRGRVRWKWVWREGGSANMGNQDQGTQGKKRIQTHHESLLRAHSPPRLAHDGIVDGQHLD